ncbi:uncharacterized protein LOC107270787 [Cephus cinctus]|uniref:Uncharacterized protein LOC107270787 n=1 Tax=Cephus cinctus TaxID=211228 RepID=A0AAJ7FP96_CEPCN|nr:uncharacterized protein LOC107270787 [Cephus cinctus]
MDNQASDNMTSEIAQIYRQIQELRAELSAEKQKVAVLESREGQNNRTESPNTNYSGINIVERLVEHLRGSKIDLPISKFSDIHEKNPQQFLKELERYCQVKDVTSENQFTVIEMCLKGRALNWFLIKKDEFRNYRDFEIKFEEEFYSVPVRIRLKSRWQERRYKLSDGNMLTYFYEQVKAAQYLSPRIGNYEIHYTIIQQLPVRVREILVTVDYADATIIVQALEQLAKSRKWEAERNKAGPSKIQNEVPNKRNIGQINLIEARQNVAPYSRRRRGNANWNNQSENRGGQGSQSQGAQNSSLPDTRFPPPPITNFGSQNQNNIQKNNLN